MAVSVCDYATLQGISPQRVRELARDGKICATKVGRVWVIEEPTDRSTPKRRPLSEKNQQALLTYLSSYSLRHVQGTERKRLAQRLRELQNAENPAELLREYFANTRLEGRGPAAIVRAALDGKDRQVQDSLAIAPRRALTDCKAVADALITMRALTGFTPEEIAEKSGVALHTYRKLECSTPLKNGNLYASMAFKSMGYSPSLVSTRKAGE